MGVVVHLRCFDSLRVHGSAQMRRVITKDLEARLATREPELTPSLIDRVVGELLPAIHERTMAAVTKHHAAESLAQMEAMGEITKAIKEKDLQQMATCIPAIAMALKVLEEQLPKLRPVPLMPKRAFEDAVNSAVLGPGNGCFSGGYTIYDHGSGEEEGARGGRGRIDTIAAAAPPKHGQSEHDGWRCWRCWHGSG